MRTYVSTLGFHETRVTRPVIKHGLDSGDRIVLVRPAEEENTERAEDAVGYVEDMVGEMEPDATVVTEQVDASEFTTTVLQCSDVLSAIDPEREVIVNFDGGAREVLLPLLVAAILHAPRIDQALQYTDVDQEVRTLSVPHLTAQLPTSAMETFELIAGIDGEITLPELARRSDKSKSTVGRHVESLAEVGVVTTRMDSSAKHVSLSGTGRLHSRARGIGE